MDNICFWCSNHRHLVKQMKNWTWSGWWAKSPKGFHLSLFIRFNIPYIANIMNPWICPLLLAISLCIFWDDSGWFVTMNNVRSVLISQPSWKGPAPLSPSMHGSCSPVLRHVIQTRSLHGYHHHICSDVSLQSCMFWCLATIMHVLMFKTTVDSYYNNIL